MGDKYMVWLALAVGLVASFGQECLLTPRPSFKRPVKAWAVHAGVWMVAYGLLALLLARPWFAVTATAAFMLILVLVNNAKYQSLREPFIFQDYDYFIDAIRHPRLYMPFFGWGKFVASVAGGAAAIAVGLWLEPAPPESWALSGHFGGVLSVLGVGAALLVYGSGPARWLTYRPVVDITRHGFLACLWYYALAGRAPLDVTSPFEISEASLGEERATSIEVISDAASTRVQSPAVKPHLVAIQSESFFDPRPMFSGIRPSVLAEFDQLRNTACLHGNLLVPAWGANTVRTEFAFLTGIEERRLGIHRFNPYRAVAEHQRMASLASWLKGQGYHTVCIHPYPASFYLRDRVFPRLGFDRFVDIREFNDAMTDGPYISDHAVAEKVAEVLLTASAPTFVMAITMENHGPLHLERVRATDIETLYTQPPPHGCDDLTIYLRNLRNADRMLGNLRSTLTDLPHPASLCWYGDHVPIMPMVYQTFGQPSGQVPYLCWSNAAGTASPRYEELGVENLAIRWMQSAGLWDV